MIYDMNHTKLKVLRTFNLRGGTVTELGLLTAWVPWYNSWPNIDHMISSSRIFKLLPPELSPLMNLTDDLTDDLSHGREAFTDL